MAHITLKGSPVQTISDLPALGAQAPDFVLVGSDLANITLKDFSGKKKVLNIVPSLDTGTCAASAKRFEQEASKLGTSVILTISADLPFAQKRFCQAEGITKVHTLSTMRSRDFGKDYGVEITTGPLAGILSRAVLVLSADNKVIYSQQVPEIADEPDYAAALAALTQD